jgi:uncharacterized caspase-like protein
MFRVLIPFLFAALCSVSASAEKRALVIGINTYDHLAPLQKAVGDARAITKTFEGTGFTVRRVEDATRETFWREWSAFIETIGEGDDVALFFSGHGLEIEGANYLLMRDAPKAGRGERIVRQEAIKFIELLAELQSRKPRVSLAILDACRNNPYAASGVRSLGGSKGLARLDPPEGAFVMYSAGANEEALDRLSESDTEPVSVYMRHLLPLLATPGLKIQDVAQQVRDQVRAVASTVPHRQNPAYYDELRGQFCFASCAPAALSRVQPVTDASGVSGSVPSPSNACAGDNPPISCLWREK